MQASLRNICKKADATTGALYFFFQDKEELLETLGLTEHQNKFPSQLSGGQQQRCTIARALIKNPKLLLLDELKGELDSKTSRDILALLEDINHRYGMTMLLVTHK